MLKNRQRRFVYINMISGRAITWHRTPLYHHNGKPDLLYGRQSVPHRCFISAAFCLPIQLCRCLNFTIRCNHKLGLSKITAEDILQEPNYAQLPSRKFSNGPVNIEHQRDAILSPSICELDYYQITKSMNNRGNSLSTTHNVCTSWCYAKVCNYLCTRTTFMQHVIRNVLSLHV